jgi:hypothetical protein
MTALLLSAPAPLYREAGRTAERVGEVGATGFEPVTPGM